MKLWNLCVVCDWLIDTFLMIINNISMRWHNNTSLSQLNQSAASSIDNSDPSTWHRVTPSSSGLIYHLSWHRSVPTYTTLNN